ncbi:MAG: membrane protein insertion efficiency factor YidD [Candidatus Levyibacteriota bacterium]
MKYIFFFVIMLYQKIISPLLKQILGVNSICRFSPSCSEYAKRSIKKNGIIKGFSLSILRLLKCQPWYKIGEEI